MRPLTRAVVATAASAAIGGTTYRIVKARRPGGAPQDGRRRHVITVYRPLAEIDGHLPEPLSAVAGKLDIQLRPAPAGRGTEVSVRALDDTVPDGDIRRVLRESRSVLEAGYVLRPGGPTTTPTVLNRALRSVTRHGREGGLL